MAPGLAVRRPWLRDPPPGDWLTLQVDTDSIIVIRGEDGAVRALHNVCRHRGSQLVAPARGSSKRIVCPYHQWTYDTAGALTFCRGMQEMDKSQFGLGRVHCEVVEGLIFISLARNRRLSSRLAN